MLLNACKDICLAVNTGKTKYMEVGSRPGMMANEHIAVQDQPMTSADNC